MRIRIAYYSGSGNTQYVAQLLRKYIKSHEVSTFFIKKNKKMDDSYDALVLGMPVYAYMPPETVLEFLRGLKGRGRPVFVYITKGLISGNAGKIAAEILKKNGFLVVGVHDILMADSLFILLSKHGTLLHRIMLLPNRGIEERVERLAAIIVDKLEKKTMTIPKGKWYVPFTRVVAQMFWKKEKKLQKAFLADERCDLCGACEGLCPRGNIRVKDAVVWEEDCEFCLRCLHRCPREAIQIGTYTLKSPRYKGP